MYPGVIVEYSDQSTVKEIVITEVRNKPLFLALFTSDKGTEKWNRVSGKDFFSMYGNNISFTKHGQPLLQAAMSINAGAELLCKRLVASDSTLANIGIVATVTSTEAQKKNENDELLYLHQDLDHKLILMVMLLQKLRIPPILLLQLILSIVLSLLLM